MSKGYIKNSLERDAFLSRRSDKKTALQTLQHTVQRLSKLMSLSEKDKAELLTYAEELLERHPDTSIQRSEMPATRRSDTSQQESV